MKPAFLFGKHPGKLLVGTASLFIDYESLLIGLLGLYGGRPSTCSEGLNQLEHIDTLDLFPIMAVNWNSLSLSDH